MIKIKPSVLSRLLYLAVGFACLYMATGNWWAMGAVFFIGISFLSVIHGIMMQQAEYDTLLEKLLSVKVER